MIKSKSTEITIHSDETIDPFMDGRLRLIQSKKGYRFSIDALLLADFVTIKKYDTIIDLGTGCGVIPLSILMSKPVKHAFCLEIQPDLANQAIKNAKINKLEGKMSVILGDMRNPPLLPCSVNAVICNPPYRKIKSGRINPDRQRAIARHEIFASIDDIIQAARFLLGTKGRISLVYPSERIPDLVTKLKQSGFEPKRMRIIYPAIELNAKLVLMEASLGGKSGLTVLPPLIGQGDYTIKSQV